MSRLLILLLAACALPTDDSGPSGGTCVLDGRDQFTSVEELECGITPDGVALCHWSLTLSPDGTWTWHGSDYGDSGTWACTSTSITAQHSGGQAIDVAWDDAAGVLTWDGVAYVPAS